MTQKRFWEVLRSLPRKGWILSFSAEFPYALRLKDKPQSQRSFSPIEAVCLVEKGKLLNEDTGAVEFLEIDADFLAEIGWAAAYTCNKNPKSRSFRIKLFRIFLHSKPPSQYHWR